MVPSVRRPAVSRVSRKAVPAVLLVLLLFPLAACGPSTPEGKVAQIRAGYTIELNSWKKVKPQVETAAADEEPAAEEGSPEGEAAASETDEAAAPAAAMGPEPTDVLFDLVVYFRGRKSLAGVTVDISHASAAQEEKGVYRQYIATSGMVNGETRQVDFVLHDLPLEDGDVFAVEVVPGVPEDLSAYREFSEPVP